MPQHFSCVLPISLFLALCAFSPHAAHGTIHTAVSTAISADDIGQAAAEINAARLRADEAAARLEAIRHAEEKSRQEISRTEKKILGLEHRQQVLTQIIRQRAVSAYKNSGDTTILIYLGKGAQDLAEYDRQNTYIDSVVGADHKHIQDIESVKQDLRIQHHELLEEKKTLASLRKEIEHESNQLFAALRSAQNAKKRLEKKRAQEQAVRRAGQLRAKSTGKAWHVTSDGLHCPVNGPVSFIDSWGFARSGGRRHKGVDMMSPHGTPLAAITSGVIDRTRSSGLGGVTIWLKGDDGHSYYYAHNSRNTVVKGQRVTAGELIGYVGSTGNASRTAPHTHFEIHRNSSSAVNPYATVRRIC